MGVFNKQQPVLLGYSEEVQALQGELLKACGYTGAVRYLLNIEIERRGLSVAVPRIIPEWVDWDRYRPAANDVFNFAIATPKVKQMLFQLLEEKHGIEKERYFNLIDPTCLISESVKFGNGVLVEQGCIFASYAEVGFGATIKRGSNIAHHVVIEDYARINPGVTVSGGCRIGNEVTIGVGATLIDGVTIGEGSIIGAGSVVTKSIPENVIAYGSPCRVVREITD